MEYETIAHLFGIAHLTICEMVYKTCQCIIEVLIVDYIIFSSDALMRSRKLTKAVAFLLWQNCMLRILVCIKINF